VVEGYVDLSGMKDVGVSVGQRLLLAEKQQTAELTLTGDDDARRPADRAQPPDLSGPITSRLPRLCTRRCS